MVTGLAPCSWGSSQGWGGLSREAPGRGLTPSSLHLPNQPDFWHYQFCELKVAWNPLSNLRGEQCLGPVRVCERTCLCVCVRVNTS